MAQTQRQRTTVGVDLGGAVQRAQHLVLSGAVEALDRSAPRRVPRLAVDQPGTEPALDHGERVVRDEAGTTVEVQQIREPVLVYDTVEPAQKEFG